MRLYPWALLILAFALNWVWEMAHMRAYQGFGGRPWLETVAGCARAAVADAVITLVLAHTVATLAKRIRVRPERSSVTYWLLSAAAAATAVLLERWGLSTGRWSYAEEMPVIPGIGVGAWPVLQLALLVPLSVWVSGRVTAGGA